jgi:membrane protease YdiL (CAAX protease family)
MNRTSSFKQRASQHPVGSFLGILVTYSAIVGTAIATVFGTAPPILRVAVYAWGPLISAGAAIWLAGESLRDWVGQLRNVRVSPWWYLAGIGVMLLGTEFETIVVLLLGGDVSAPAAPLLQYVLLFGVTLFLAGALEELGWRGFLQPRLQQRFTAIGASVGIGLLWTAWHVPMILAGLGNFAAFWEYTLNVTAISILFGWLYNSTNAGLPVVMIAHASHNLPPAGMPTGTVPPVFNVLSGDTMAYLLCALAVVAYAGAQTLTRNGALPQIPGKVGKRSQRAESLGD